MAPEPEKEITMDEVSKHNTTDDCWIVIGNDDTGEIYEELSHPSIRRRVRSRVRERAESFLDRYNVGKSPVP